MYNQKEIWLLPYLDKSYLKTLNFIESYIENASEFCYGMVRKGRERMNGMKPLKRSFGKRFVSVMLSAAVTTAVFVHTVPVVFAASATTTSSLNVRTGPGTSYKIVKTLAKGATVEALDSGTNGWIKVKLADGTTGYCSAEFLKVASSSSGSAAGSYGTLTLDTRSYVMAPGNIYDFRAKVEGIGLKQEDVKVYSSRTGIAGLARVPGTDKYRITGLKEGVCYVMAEVAGRHASIKITVQKGVKQHGEATRSITLLGDHPDIPDNSSSSGGNSSNGGQSTPVTLDTKSYQFSQVGSVYQFLARGIPKGSAPVAVSSNPSVVSLTLKNANDSRGYLYEIKSVAPGSAVISVTYGTYTAQMPVTVAGSSNSSGGSSSSGSGGTTDPKTITGARTTTAVNLRSGPSTDTSRLALLAMGTTVEVLDTSSSEWTKVRTTGGVVGYLYTDYIQFIYDNDSSYTGTLRLSHTSGTIPQGKSYYITATGQPSGSTVTWKSSNPNVASVSNGFIYGNQAGTAVITASLGSSTVSCNVTVTAAEPVRVAYTSPNVASIGQQVQLVAVTDNTRSAVRFVVDMNDGTQRVLDTTNYTTETSTSTGLATTNTRVWKVATTFANSGTYKVTAYSSAGSSGYSSTGVTTSSFVVNAQDKTICTVEGRRVSDEMLTLISKWEGYSAAVYPDTLAYNIPTIGYGQTFSAGTLFYNNQTKTESWAHLLNSVNSSYTTAVNTFILNNNIRANQQHFDAMVSFSYNVGAGHWNGTTAFDIRQILLNSVTPPNIQPGDSLSARASLNFDLYTTPDINSGRLTEVVSGALLQVLQVSVDSSTKSVWYQVQTQNGLTGWAKNGYIALDNAASLQRDLSYTDAGAIGTEWLRWNQAGGKVYPGLVYRRLGESKVFSFGNYAEANNAHSNYRKNTYGYIYPTSAKPYEQ